MNNDVAPQAATHVLTISIYSSLHGSWWFKQCWDVTVVDTKMYRDGRYVGRVFADGTGTLRGGDLASARFTSCVAK
ncbi:hypothetical protein LZC95_50105 [Pendulispora brunnea]|uniref:Uncharacterized protein n=1 Tax=Pendulispora brunnea TaxID=2905690 RepID=A0ABZ2K795_9BACT